MIESYRTFNGLTGCWRCFWCESATGNFYCHSENRFFKLNNGDRLYHGKMIQKTRIPHPDFNHITKILDPKVGCDDWMEEVI